MDCLGLLDGQPLVRDLGLARLHFFHPLAHWAINSGNLVYLHRSLRRMLHMDIDYVGGNFTLTPCWLVMVRGKVCVEWMT